MLSIKNLHASIEDKEILKGINLEIKAGEVHAIMGPNGSGKSTLSAVLAGREEYEVTKGEVDFGGEDILEMSPEDRAREGLFLAFPTKPKDFDIQKAKSLEESSVRVVMICGEQDKRFYPGQIEISRLLDSVKVENKFIKYPNLGHGFPNDFDSQLDQGLIYILDNEW
mgnify:CR=1 FL=1